MQRNPTNLQNPNYRVGCHPLDFNGYFEGHPLCSNQTHQFSIQSVDPLHIAQHQCIRRQVLDRILYRAATHKLSGIEHFAQYLKEKYRRNCRPRTLQITADTLIAFLSFFHNLGKNQIDLICRQDIEAFIEHEQDRGLKPNTVRTHLCVVYAFLRHLVANEVLGHEMLERRIKLKLPETLPRAIEPEHIRQLLSVIDHIRDRALIMLLLRTGMRIGELLNTTVNDIDLNNQRVLIYEAEKTGVGRVVYFSADALEALISWLRMRDPLKTILFYGRGRRSLSYETARNIFKKYLQKSGLHNHGYTLHCLRHTFATDLLNARMPLECLRVLLGHTNLDVTRRYARLTDKTREEEYFNAMDKVIKNDFGEYDQCDD
jgi:integrase/recombinase XerD